MPVLAQGITDETLRYWRFLLTLPGVTKDFLAKRVRTLQMLMPPEARESANAFALWYQGLNGWDRIFVWALPGAPLLRDSLRAMAVVGEHKQTKAFLNNPANSSWWVQSRGGSVGPASPEQREFATWYAQEFQRTLGTGVASQAYYKSTPWQQMRADLFSSLPYMLLGGAVKTPADLFLRHVVSPVLRGARGVLLRVAPPVGRIFLRGGEALADYTAQQVMRELRSLIPPAMQDQILATARPLVTQLRGRIQQSLVQKTIIFKTAEQRLLGWMKEVGADSDHLFVLERWINTKDEIWQKSLETIRATQGQIDTFKAQLKVLTPGSTGYTAVEKQIEYLQNAIIPRLKVGFQNRIDAVTVDSVVSKMKAEGYLPKLTWTPRGTARVHALWQRLHAHMDTLYPPGSPGYRPWYMPEPPPAVERAGRRVAQVAVDFYDLNRVTSQTSKDAAEVFDKLVYRMAAPEWRQVGQVGAKEFQQFIDQMATQVQPMVADRIKDGLSVLRIDLKPGAVAEASMRITKWWRDAVLIGRMTPWIAINTLGNIVNTSLYVMDQWMKGRAVNPIEAFKRMKVPLFVSEAFSRQVMKDPGAFGLGAIRDWLYGRNAIVESAFRGGIYKMEYSQAVRELTAKGLAPADIPDLARQMGWDKVNKYLYNYGDSFWGVRLARGVFPFSTYQAENAAFWVREFAQKPWLMQALAHAVEARPELAAPAGQFLRSIGVDARIIDVMTKFNFFDVMKYMMDTRPAWLQDREKDLAKNLSDAMTRYANDPVKLQFWAKTHPDEWSYKRYAEQKLVWSLLDRTFSILGANFLGDAVLEAAQVQRWQNFKRGLFPQQRLIGLLAQQMKIPWFSKWWEDPSEGQLTEELRLMTALGHLSGDLAKDRATATHRWYVKQLSDAVIDLYGMSGYWRSQIMDDIRESLKRDRDAWSQGRFIPEPEDVFEIMHTFKIPDVAYATIIAAQRMKNLGSDLTSAERKARARAFDLLPAQIQDLIKTSADPDTKKFWETVNGAFGRFQVMSPVDRRRFLQGNSMEARLVNAILASQYTADELSVVRETQGFYPSELKNWYYTQPPEKKELFRQIYPRSAAQFDEEEFKGVPPSFIAPPHPDSKAPSSPSYPSRDSSNAPTTSGGGSGYTVDAPPPIPGKLGPPPVLARYTVAQVAKAIAKQEGDGTYGQVSQMVEKPKGQPETRSLGKYQFLPGTIIAMGYGRDLDSQNPADYLDPNRAKQLAARWLNNPQAQEQAMEALIRANAKALGFDPNQGFTLDQVGLLGVAHNAGSAFALRVATNPAVIQEKPNVRAYKAHVEANAAAQQPGVPAARGVIEQTPVEKRARAAAQQAPPAPDEAYVQRKIDADGGLKIYLAGGTAQAMLEYIHSVNPDLDPKKAQKIVDTILALHADPASAGVPQLDAKSFDPMWILAIIAERSKFNPDYDKDGRRGLMGLVPGLFPELTDETIKDESKNIKAGVAAFFTVQRSSGTKPAVQQFGVDYDRTYRRATDPLGLRPVVVTPFDPKKPGYTVLGTPDSLLEKDYAEFISRLLWAGGSRDAPDFLSKRQQEWGDEAKRASPVMLDMLKYHFPDLYFFLKEAAAGTPYWFRGKVVIERGNYNYLEWKHRILVADSVESAVKVYQSGSDQFRAWFSSNNGDMAMFFKDYVSGVHRDYQTYVFTDDQDNIKYVPARRRLAIALATGRPEEVQKAVREITSIYGEDMPGFVRKLKTDTPPLFEAAKAYLTTQAYGADEKLQVRAYLQGVNSLLEDFRRTGNAESLQLAAAQWLNPENLTVKALIREHQTDQYAEIERRLAGVPAPEHYIADDEYVGFQTFANDLQRAYQKQDATTLQRMWQAAPESFKKEFQAYHGAYYDYAPIIEGEEPSEWVTRRERSLAAPYLHYLRMDDAFGAYSPLKLQQILKESPWAFNYIMQDPEELQSIRATLQQRTAGLYTGVLRQYNYSPALLAAIPDDGTRHLISLVDPRAQEAFRIHKISVTPSTQPVIPKIPALLAEGARVEQAVDEATGQPILGQYTITRVTPPSGGFGPGIERISISAEDLTKQYASLMEVPTTSPEFLRLQDQFRTNQGIVSALRLVYQGVQISQQGGGFIEQLPAYFGAAQAAAAAGLFTGGAASFLLGPLGLLAGGVLGILGGIFGANRQREEAAARQRAEAAARAQFETEQVRERLRGLTSQQLGQIDRAAGGTITRFLQRPSAITRQALVDALAVPRPTW